ncbi:spermidine/putrescine ABC transporter substrate-binding protein [Candidatus Dependentiae bacterium]|nr:MAG: spermidine/putrescine ABC transporter substrate-binding protein [Candidatus Dependentiae bacterium]
MEKNQLFNYDVIIKSIIIFFWLCIAGSILYSSSKLLSKKNERSLNILAWPQIIDGDFLTDFEEQTGIRVNISYFESNEELLAKLRGTKNHGYDLIMPSDYMLQTFINELHIKEINKTKLTFWQDLEPALLNNKNDPLNHFTIPCFWTVFGIGLNLNHFNGQLPEDISWKLLFDYKQKQKPIGMMENIVQMFSIAQFYLNSKHFVYDDHASRLESTLTLLILQKKYRRVVAYTESRIEYMLASGECAACLCSSADIAKMVNHFDHIAFAIPKEGTFASLDSFAITSQTTKDDLIYAFLNYIYQPNIMKKYVEKFQFPAPLKSIPDENLPAGISFDIYNHIPVHSFEHWLTPEEIEYIWLTLRAA